MRNEFKKVKIKDSTYLYPVPVVKGNKYLILVDEEFADFFIESWRNDFLSSPDQRPEYLKFFNIHSDQQTNIFVIDFNKLSFTFLNQQEAKALKIQEVLTGKIASYLAQKDSGNKEDLTRAFEKQMSCKTCLDLGIKSSEVVTWISKLIQISQN